MTDWIEVIWLSVPWATLAGLLIYFIKNPEKVEKWGSVLAKTFSFASAKWERASVAKDIQSDINSFAKKVAGKGNTVLPYKAKINWVSSTTKEAFVKANKVVIKMGHHNNQARNFLNVTLEWIHCGLIPESRHLIDPNVLRSLDFTMVNKVLTETKRHDAKQLFFSEIYEPEVKSGSLLEQYCSAFSKLDERGTLMGVALPEYALLGEIVGSSMPNPQIQAETISFAGLLMRLANKQHGIDIDTTYQGQYVNCSIMLVARYETYLSYGLEPYLKFINQCQGKGVKLVYVVGQGKNVKVVKRIKDAYENNKKVVFDWENSITNSHGESSVVRFKLK